MQNSPCDTKGVIRSKTVVELEKGGFLEVARFPMIWPDYMILNEIESDRKLLIYASENYGVCLITHGACKSFFVNTHPLSPQSPSYSKKGRAKKHRQDRKSCK